MLIFNFILDQCDGISFVDSSSIEVCKKYHISRNKVFAGIAATWPNNKRVFYSLKLHLIINRGGSIVKASFSPDNKDDRKQLELMDKNLFGKVFGDRGYISQEFFQQLLEQGIFMVTRVKKNIKIKLIA